MPQSLGKGFSHRARGKGLEKGVVMLGLGPETPNEKADRRSQTNRTGVGKESCLLMMGPGGFSKETRQLWIRV